MVTKATDPVLNLFSDPITQITMDTAGGGINLNGAPLIGLPQGTDPSDAARISDVQANVLPSGVGPIPWSGDEGSVPSGWLLCDGTIYNIATYPALYAAIGAKFGGDDISTFAVPDCRGRIPLGKDNMGGSAAGRVTGATLEGVTGGSQTHTLTVSEMPEHDHSGSTGNAGGHTHSGSTNTTGSHAHGGGGNSGCGQGSGDNNLMNCGRQSTDSAGNHSHTLTINSVSDHTHSLNINDEGGDQPHNNLQPYVVVNYIIKA